MEEKRKLPSISAAGSPTGDRTSVCFEAARTPHDLYATKTKRPPYILVVPSYGRPDRLQSNTLGFLRHQGIPQERIEVWLAPGCAPGETITEEERYRRALIDGGWPRVRLRIGVKGIMEQRWHIGSCFPEGTHIVSIDDDVPEVSYKFRPGTGGETLRPLPPGSFESLIHHAHDMMVQEGSYIWGLNPSANPMNMVVDRISRRNGMVNGFLYGYRNRHDASLRSVYCSPTEDVERSCRMYERDGVVLRYLMYSGRTIFKAPGGISNLYVDGAERKAAEEQAIRDIAAEFPHLLSVRCGEERRKTQAAMNFRFRSVGQSPLLSDGSVRKALHAGPFQVDSSVKEGPDALPLPGDPDELARQMREAADEKALIGRCVELQERLARCSETEGSAASKTSGCRITAPAVLDDIVKIATRGSRTLATLGINPMGPRRSRKRPRPCSTTPPPPERDPDDAAYGMLAADKLAAAVAVATHSGSAGEAGVMKQPLADQAEEAVERHEEPVLAPPLPQWETQDTVVSVTSSESEESEEIGEAQGVAPSDPFGEDLHTFKFSGFYNAALNATFHLDRVMLIRGRHSFWSRRRDLFMYWQDGPARWAIVQRWDRTLDVLDAVRQGENRGWACQQGDGLWIEFWMCKWRQVRPTPTCMLRYTCTEPLQDMSPPPVTAPEEPHTSQPADPAGPPTPPPANQQRPIAPTQANPSGPTPSPSASAVLAPPRPPPAGDYDECRRRAACEHQSAPPAQQQELTAAPLVEVSERREAGLREGVRPDTASKPQRLIDPFGLFLQPQETNSVAAEKPALARQQLLAPQWQLSPAALPALVQGLPPQRSLHLASAEVPAPCNETVAQGHTRIGICDSGLARGAADRPRSALRAPGPAAAREELAAPPAWPVTPRSHRREPQDRQAEALLPTPPPPPPPESWPLASRSRRPGAAASAPPLERPWTKDSAVCETEEVVLRQGQNRPRPSPLALASLRQSRRRRKRRRSSSSSASRKRSLLGI